MSVTHEEDRKGAAVVPWLRQSIPLLRAGVVLVADTAAEQKIKKNGVLGVSMALLGSAGRNAIL